LPQLRQFVEGTTEVEFRRCGKDDDRYRHIEGVLRRLRYARLKRADRGLVVRYVMRTTGYSRPQLVRLIKRAQAGALEKGYRAPMSISNGHLYNLRQCTGYLERRRQWTKTHATQVSIGERRAPTPDVPTTASSTSITRWPSCSTSCGWNSPTCDRATPTTTGWPKPRMGR
jgi:hypothetical protein